MFTHLRFSAFTILCAIAVFFTCQSVRAQESGARAIPYGEVTENASGTIDDPRVQLEEPNTDSTDLIDAVDKYYPADTGSNVYDSRVQLEEPTTTQSTDLIDAVDKYYPANTSGNIEDPRYQMEEPQVETNSMEFLDTIDRLNKGEAR